MSKSTRKIVAGLLTFAMVLTLVVGLAAAPAGAQTVSFTRSLTVGSRGADVMQLQTLLQAQGFFTATPTGYFGTLTKRAVAAWQASEGISPAAGYFGPISRAQLVAVAPTTPTTTPSGVAGCPSGAVYNYITGALCSTPTPSTTTGVEGSLTINRAPTVISSTNIQTNTDVPVYGLQLKAKLGDVTVNRLDLDVAVSNAGSFENPGNFVNTIKVWDGSTLLKSWAVGTGDFNTGTTSQDYYVRLSGINFVVAKDTTKNLVVTFSTNGGIDVSRTLTVTDYGTNPLLTTSGNNVVSYYDPNVSFIQTFQKPGTANLTVAADVSNPLSQTYRVNPSSSSITNATLMTFSAKSDTGDSKITSVTVRATSSQTGANNGPTALYLYDGSTPLGQVSTGSWTAGTAQTVTFNDLSIVVSKDATKVLTITGDFQPSTTEGTIASTTVSAVTYEKPNGSSATLALNVQGNNQYVYTVSPQWTILGATAVSGNANQSGSTTQVTATFSIKVTPVGGTMVEPTVSNFVVKVGTTSTPFITIADGSKGISISPTVSNGVLAENAPYTITLTATAYNADLPANGSETFYITSAASNIGGTSTTQTWGLSNFKTNPASFVK